MNPPVRANRLKPALASGRALLGASVTFSQNPALMALLCNVGIDYVEIDLEHSSMSTEVAADMAMQARALDLPVLVRPPAGHGAVYGPFLDAGAWGLCLAGVETLTDAREIVRATRHAPMGNRGTFEPGPQNDYQDDPQDLAALNAQLHITVILRSLKACEAAASMLAVDGIDAIEIDRAVLTREIERTGADAVGQIARIESDLVAAALRHDKVVSAPARDHEEMRRLLALGVRLLRFQSDEEVLRRGYSRIGALCRDAALARAAG